MKKIKIALFLSSAMALMFIGTVLFVDANNQTRVKAYEINMSPNNFAKINPELFPVKSSGKDKDDDPKWKTYFKNVIISQQATSAFNEDEYRQKHPEDYVFVGDSGNFIIFTDSNPEERGFSS